MPSYYSIDIEQIKRLNQEKGFYFFSPDTMRFFHSRTSTTALKRENGTIAYFITSEQREHDAPRKYTIRKCNMKSGDISTVGNFHEYDTRMQAQSEMLKIIMNESREMDRHGAF